MSYETTSSENRLRGDFKIPRKQPKIELKVAEEERYLTSLPKLLSGQQSSISTDAAVFSRFSRRNQLNSDEENEGSDDNLSPSFKAVEDSSKEKTREKVAIAAPQFQFETPLEAMTPRCPTESMMTSTAPQMLLDAPRSSVLTAQFQFEASVEPERQLETPATSRDHKLLIKTTPM